MGRITASRGRAIASTVRATVPSTPRAALQALADHHRGPRRPTTTTPSHPCRGGCGRPHAPSVSCPPHGTYVLPGPYASPHADPPPFMRATLHACRLPVPPPSRTQALCLIMAEPLPRTRLPRPQQVLCQCHHAAIRHDKSPCPVPAAVVRAAQTRAALPVTPTCCHTPAPTAGGVSASSTTSVMSHASSTSSRWMRSIVFGRPPLRPRARVPRPTDA